MPIVERNGQKIWVPKSSGSTKQKSKTTTSGRSTSRVSSSGFGEDIARLEDIARRNELDVPKEGRVKTALGDLIGVLNTPLAGVAGAVRGVLRSDKTIGQGIKEGIENRRTFGFADVLREDLNLPKSASGAAGFGLDVALDPLNLLTFGATKGLKLGGKTLTKEAADVATDIAKKQLPKRFLRSGDSITESLTNFLGSEDEVKKVIKNRLGKDSKLFDDGGIKVGQKSIVSSDQIKEISKKLQLDKVKSSVPVQTAKEAFGKAFVADYGLPENFVRIKDKLAREKRQVVDDIVKRNRVLFQDLSDDEAREFFDTVFAKKASVLKKQEAIETNAIKELNRLYPTLKVDSPDKARRVLNALEDITEQEITRLRARVDEIVQPIFRERARARRAGQQLGDGIGGLQETPALRGLSRVDELSKVVDDLKKELKQFKKQSTTNARQAINSGEVLDKEEVINVHNRIIQAEEERLLDQINSLEDRLKRAKEAPEGATGGRPRAPRMTPAEELISIDRQIRNLTTSFDDKQKILTEIVNARRGAKQQLRQERLVFDNPKLQELSDKLFEGENAVVAQLARDAGIPKEDAIKFYIPSKFRSRVEKQRVGSTGSPLSSPELNFQKLFTGYTGEDLIRDPFEVYTRGQIAVANARIKTNAIKKIVEEFGFPIDAFPSEQAAKLRGYKKYERKVIDGKVEAWLPESLIDDVNELMQPKNNIIDDLAKATGFDYVTGLFKGYVTSLFPSFHVRNLTSNQFQLSLEFAATDINPRMQQLASQIRRGVDEKQVIKFNDGREMTVGAIRNKLQNETDFFQKGAFGDVEQFLTGGANITQKERTLNPLSRKFYLLEKGRELGGAEETRAKILGVLAGLNRGESFSEAIKSTERALFNYSKLTDFERTVMRRLIPFYTFMKKNAEFQTQVLLHRPVKTANQFKAIRGVGDTFFEPVDEEDREGLPTFIQEGIGFKLPGQNQFGQEQFLAGLGLPIEEFFGRFSGEDGIIWNAVRSVVEGANPTIKFPIERITGVDIFRGRPITEITNADDFNSFIDMMPNTVAEQFKDWIDYREIKNAPVYKNGVRVGTKSKYVADPYKLHFFRNLPTARFLSSAGVASEPESTTATKILRLGTGAKPYAIDEEQQKFYKDLERKRELENFLIRMGVVGRFQNVFEKTETTR